ncbi:MAG TPA: RDD family protein [Myxococcaceae bacterium]|nr:RDD family protein [Myxococcaceae bacterium]
MAEEALPPLLDGVHRVLTPEYVEFDFVLAGLMSRFLAWAIDLLIILGLTLATAMLVSNVFALFPGLGQAVMFVAFFLIDWGYGICTETFWSGQTVGKRALGLRVIQQSGVRIGFLQAVLRNLARLVDRQPAIFLVGPGLYLLGGAVAVFSGSGQRLGDMVAGTVVIRERRTRLPASIVRPAADSPFGADPRWRAALGRVSSEERELLISAALRREELANEARLKLFAALSDRLQRELSLEKPPHLSDENLVLWVVSTLVGEQQKKPRAPLRGGTRAPG